MRDIAAELGVSVITVSKVLRNQGRISKQMRERVLKLAKELNYRPDLTAQSLATGRTFLIGAVVPGLTHLFFAAFAKALAKNLRQEGYVLVICSSDEDPALELQEIENLLARRIDALVLASSERAKSSGLFRRLEEVKVPYVLFDRPARGLNCDFVGSDHTEIGRMATKHLIGRGYRRIAHIGISSLNIGNMRLNGYKDALKKSGLNIDPDHIVLVESGDEQGEECGYKAMQELLRSRPSPDAVFCFNDIIAFGAQKAILEAGYAIPGDIALIGASNISGLSFWNPLKVPLSSIDQDVEQLAAQVTKRIHEMHEPPAKRRPTKVFVPLKLVIRESS
jgi:LacI family transcriptional regulator